MTVDYLDTTTNNPIETKETTKEPTESTKAPEFNQEEFIKEFAGSIKDSLKNIFGEFKKELEPKKTPKKVEGNEEFQLRFLQDPRGVLKEMLDEAQGNIKKELTSSYTEDQLKRDADNLWNNFLTAHPSLDHPSIHPIIRSIINENTKEWSKPGMTEKSFIKSLAKKTNDRLKEIAEQHASILQKDRVVTEPATGGNFIVTGTTKETQIPHDDSISNLIRARRQARVHNQRG